MNQVYISGFIVGKPVFRMEKENTPHMILTLDVQHKNSVGKVVMIRGYLTQRAQFSEEKMMIVTEVTAEEFMPARQFFKRKTADEVKQPIPEKERAV